MQLKHREIGGYAIDQEQVRKDYTNYFKPKNNQLPKQREVKNGGNR